MTPSSPGGLMLFVIVVCVRAIAFVAYGYARRP
jgi:hypothetical protein